MFSKIFTKTTKKDTKSSDFSKFFREASSSKKKKVFLEVARQATKDQLDVINDKRLAR
jgi:hypothetical protein